MYEYWVHDPTRNFNFGTRDAWVDTTLVTINGRPATEEEIAEKFVEQFPDCIYFAREVW